MLILKSSPREVKMLCSLLLYKELPQEVCWQCSRIYTVTLPAILTPWTQQGASRSGWSSSFITDTTFLRSVRFIIIPGTGFVFIIVPLVSIHEDDCISGEGTRSYHSGRAPGGGHGNPLSPWTEQPGGLQSIGLHGVGPGWSELSTARLHYPDLLWHPPSSCYQAVSTHHGDQ